MSKWKFDPNEDNINHNKFIILQYNGKFIMECQEEKILRCSSDAHDAMQGIRCEVIIVRLGQRPSQLGAGKDLKEQSTKQSCLVYILQKTCLNVPMEPNQSQAKIFEK